MLAYEKVRHQAGPTPWRSRCFAVVFFLLVLILQIPNIAEELGVSVYSLLWFTINSCSVHYVVLLEKISIRHPCSALFYIAGAVLDCPQYYAFYLGSPLFALVFFEEEERRRGGNS